MINDMEMSQKVLKGLNGGHLKGEPIDNEVFNLTVDYFLGLDPSNDILREEEQSLLIFTVPFVYEAIHKVIHS